MNTKRVSVSLSVGVEELIIRSTKELDQAQLDKAIQDKLDSQLVLLDLYGRRGGEDGYVTSIHVDCIDSVDEES